MSRKIFRTAGTIVVGIAAVLAAAGQLHAQLTVWNGSLSTSMSTAANWSSGAPTASDIQVRFDPTGLTGSQLSPVNDISGGTIQTVWLGKYPSGPGGGFNITGNSLTLAGNSTFPAITDYGNNTWGLDTTLAGAMTFKSATAGTTLTLSGTINTGGSPVTISGAGNVTFTQPTLGFSSLDMKGSGTVSVAPIPNLSFGGTLVVAGSGLDVNFGDITAESGNVALGNYIGWAGEWGQNSIDIFSGATVTMTGPLAVPPANPAQHGGMASVILGSGTLVLAQSNSSLTNPDISSSFFRSDLVGDIISPNVELAGNSQHYVQMWAQSYTQSSSQGEEASTYATSFRGESLDFAGGLSGSAGLTFDGEPAYATINYSRKSPAQATLGLQNDNSAWSGGLQIYSGNVILSHSNALTAANAVSFAIPDSNHAGGLYLNGISTAIGSLSGTGGGSMLLVNGGTSNVSLTINQTSDGTYSGQIADGPDQGWAGGPGLIQGGQFALVLQGGNTLTLNGANSYSGGTSILAGTLRIGSTTALGSSSGSLAISGGTLDLNGNSTAVGGLSGTSAAIVNSQPNFATLTTNSPAGSTTYAGTIGGRVTLNKGGAGTLALDAANTFSGAAAVNGGQLELDFSAGLATVNILPSDVPLGLAGGNLWLNGGGYGSNSQALGNLTFGPGGSAITVTTGGAAVAITAGNTWTRSPGSALDVALSGGTLTSSPAVSATSNVVVGSGSGPTAFAVVSGAGTTDWATVSSGKVAALSSGGYANNTYSSGENTNVTALNPSPVAFTTDTLAFRTAQANTLTLSGTGLSTLNLGGLLVGAQVGGYATTITGGTLTSGSNELVVQQYDANSGGSFTLNSQIANNGGTPLLLTKAGPGQLVLGNAGNSFTGGTVVGGGTLTLGAAGALGPASNPLWIAGGVLDLNGQAATVGGLSGGVGSITNNAAVAAAASLTVNNSATSTFGGTIADGSLAGNTVTLNKQGPGTLILTGSNTYSGGTNITGGVLSVSQDANLGAASSPLYLNGGTLNVTTPGNGKSFASYSSPTPWASGGITDDCASTMRPISWGSSGATFNIADPANIFTISQQLTAAACQGDLVKTGPGTLWLNAPNLTNTYAGSTKILGGSMVLDYSGDPGYGDRYPFQQKIGTGPLVLGNATLSFYDSGPGYYGPGAAVYLGATVSGLTLLPGDSQLQTNITYSGFNLTGGSGTVTRQVGGSLNMQGEGDTYTVGPNYGSPGTVNAWLTTSTFITTSALTPVPATNYWDTEFAGLSASSYTVGGTVQTIQPNIGLWTTGQDVTNATALNVTGTDSTAALTGSSSFSSSLASNLAIDSLRILPAAASNVNLGGNTLQINSGGILVAFNCVNAGGVNGAGFLTQISNGTLTAGNANYGGDLIVQQYNVGVAYPQYSSTGGALLISAAIANAPNPAGARAILPPVPRSSADCRPPATSTPACRSAARASPPGPRSRPSIPLRRSRSACRPRRAMAPRRRAFPSKAPTD